VRHARDARPRHVLRQKSGTGGDKPDEFHLV
jgi:hypothetical protein